MPTKALILTPSLPEDFKITLLPELEEKKEKLISRSGALTEVPSILVRDKAIALATDIATHLKKVEVGREEAKGPFFKIGQAIDAAAREHREKLEVEKKRLDLIVGAFNAEQERQREEQARKLRQEAADQEAEATRKRNEAAAALADSQQSNAPTFDALSAALDAENAEDDAAKARRAEEDRLMILAENQRKQSPKGGSQRFEVEVKITDIKALLAAQPLCVKLIPDIPMIKSFDARGIKLPGVEITKTPIFQIRSR